MENGQLIGNSSFLRYFPFSIFADDGIIFKIKMRNQLTTERTTRRYEASLLPTFYLKKK